jgi:hypothetical protein
MNAVLNDAQVGRALAAIDDFVASADSARQMQLTEYDRAKARMDVLIEDKRVEVLPDGRYRYHLDEPIRLGKSKESMGVETLTFDRCPLGTWRESCRIPDPNDRVFYLMTKLCVETKDATILDQMDANQWDAIVEVIEFPLERPPSRPPRKETAPGGTCS